MSKNWVKPISHDWIQCIPIYVQIYSNETRIRLGILDNSIDLQGKRHAYKTSLT